MTASRPQELRSPTLLENKMVGIEAILQALAMGAQPYGRLQQQPTTMQGFPPRDPRTVFEALSMSPMMRNAMGVNNGIPR